MSEPVERVVVQAPAKVNLRLKVLAREESGYHALETLFCAIDLADELVVERGGRGVELHVAGSIETGPPEENLVVRAARRFAEEAGVGRQVRIHLAKRIPSAAGLGGGSSDAAATLRALNALHGEPLSHDRLLGIASSLGSDVPFFLCGSPYALAWGRGERLLTLPPLPPRPVLVAHPGEPMPTGEAFRRIAESRAGGYAAVSAVLRLDRLGSWEGVAEIAGNDFEAPAVERIPRLRGAVDRLREAGAIVALLAGSGASVFGVFDGDHITDVARDLEEIGFTTFTARTLASMPEATPSAG